MKKLMLASGLIAFNCSAAIEFTVDNRTDESLAFELMIRRVNLPSGPKGGCSQADYKKNVYKEYNYFLNEKYETNANSVNKISIPDYNGYELKGFDSYTCMSHSPFSGQKIRFLIKKSSGAVTDAGNETTFQPDKTYVVTGNSSSGFTVVKS